jgi:antitoxin component YwqK of YwqJK toxin-antitoxin module
MHSRLLAIAANLIFLLTLNACVTPGAETLDSRNPASLVVTQLKEGEYASICSGKNNSLGGREGLWECFYENGVRQWEMHYKNGKREGAFNFWKIDGNPVFTSQWKEGFLDGEMIHFFDKDHRKLESHFKMGRIDGLDREWDPSGVERMSSEFKDGLLNGVVKEWFEDGQIRSEGHYNNDLLDGPYLEWWRNGQLRRQGRFSKGQKAGVWRYFDPQGRSSNEIEDALRSNK